MICRVERSSGATICRHGDIIAIRIDFVHVDARLVRLGERFHADPRLFDRDPPAAGDFLLISPGRGPEHISAAEYHLRFKEG